MTRPISRPIRNPICWLLPTMTRTLACAAGLLLTACDAPETTGASGAGDARSESVSDATPADVSAGQSATGGERTTIDGFTIVHDDWANIGFRWDWVARPALTDRTGVRFIDGYDDVVVVQSGSNHLSVLEANSGRQRWATAYTNPLTKFLGNTRDGNRLIHASESELFIVSLDGGNLEDRQGLRRVINTRPLLHATPSSGMLALMGTPAGNVQAHLLSQNIRAWSYGLGGTITSQPILVDGSLIAVSQNGLINFINVDAQSSYATHTMNGGLVNDPVTDGARVYIASLDQSVYSYDIATGSRAWRHRTDSPLRGQPAVADGKVFIQTSTVGMLALSTDRGQRIWTSDVIRGELVSAKGGDGLFWDKDTASFFFVDLASGDVLEQATMPGLVRVAMDNFEGGNLLGVTKAGVVLRFTAR